MIYWEHSKKWLQFWDYFSGSPVFPTTYSPPTLSGYLNERSTLSYLAVMPTYGIILILQWSFGSLAGKSLVVVKLPTLEWTPCHWFSCWRADTGSTNQSTQHPQMKCEPMTPHVFQESVHAALINNLDEKIKWTTSPLVCLARCYWMLKAAREHILQPMYMCQCTCTWKYLCR